MAENAPGVCGVRVRVAVARRVPAPTGPPLADPPRVSTHGRSCGMDDRDHLAGVTNICAVVERASASELVYLYSADDGEQRPCG